MPRQLRIGSRPSRLALAQSEIIQRQIEGMLPGLVCQIVPIKTTGDKLTTPSLAQVGGKGLFVRELEQALEAGRIDIAVHSMKDMPAVLAPRFRLLAVPAREDTADVLLSAGPDLSGLARGARLGTSSLRRRFEALRLRPDLDFAPLRGNIDTRLAKLTAGEFDAIILAAAGLKRLGHTDLPVMHRLNRDDFVPAGGQGALAIEALAQRTITDFRRNRACRERTRRFPLTSGGQRGARLPGGNRRVVRVANRSQRPRGGRPVINLRVAVQSRRRALDDRAASSCTRPQISRQPRRLASNWRGGCWRAARAN